MPHRISSKRYFMERCADMGPFLHVGEKPMKAHSEPIGIGNSYLEDR